MSIKQIRIGTRGSKLALYQADQVKFLLNNLFPDLLVHIELIQTKGDKILDTALSKIGDKGLFTKEIELALLENRIDIAVHSLKDLSTEIPEGLMIGAVLKRGEYRDALVHIQGKKLDELTGNDVIATSSLRRKAGLAMLNNSMKIIDIRGNVNTRIKKMEDGYCDGMIMAAAGLIRLGLESYITELIEPDLILPAVGQGAIAIECCDDKEFDTILAAINDRQTMTEIRAERAFLKAIEGGCQVPVGGLCQKAGKELIIKGFISSIDGKNRIKDSIEGLEEYPESLGIELAENILSKGGDIILHDVRSKL